MATISEKRNSRDEQIDKVHTHDDVEKPLPEAGAELDYTGVSKKTDPEEIKLVRKLDYMIMVSQMLSPAKK